MVTTHEPAPSLTQERRAPNAFGLDIEVGDFVTKLAAGRRKVGFIAHPDLSGQIGSDESYRVYVYSYDQRLGHDLPRFKGATSSLQSAIELTARAYREQTPSWLGHTR